MAENGFTEQQMEPSDPVITRLSERFPSSIETMVAPGRMSYPPYDNYVNSDAVTLPSRIERALRMPAFRNSDVITSPVATALGMLGLPNDDTNIINLVAITRANRIEQALRMSAFRNSDAGTSPVATALGMVGLPNDDTNINLDAITRANCIEQASRMSAFLNSDAITLRVATALGTFGLPNNDTNIINLDAITRASRAFWNSYATALGMLGLPNDDTDINLDAITRASRAFWNSYATALGMLGLPNDDTDINLDAITRPNRTQQALRMSAFRNSDAITSANTESVTDYIDRRRQGYAPVPPLASTLDPEHVAIAILDREDAPVPKKALNTKAALLSGVRETVVVAAAVPLIAVAFDNIRGYRELYPTNSRDWVRVTGFCFLTFNTLMFLAGSYMVMDFTWSKLSRDPKAFYVKSFLATVMGLACVIFALMVCRCLF